ncbi:MAG: DPP IV N-terminal domain-containing protein [Acidobacteria bacterium]|nr:DPP IV N-terminal domain-containing protein [Acidobacteriota bacterium]MBI3426236.1 DPP IV N-terminal domain-containing protein [Acidobacteriota bacterium]
MPYNTGPLVLRAGVRPNWLPDGRLWYRVTTEQGNEFILVDPARGTRGAAFDHVKLAAALAAATGTKVGAYQLPFQQIDFAADGKSLSFSVDRRRISCDVQGEQCRVVSEGNGNREAGQRGGQRGGPGANAMATSPDSKRVAFIRDYNLWVRDAATGKETQLTTDGVKDFGYATNNAGWTKSDTPVLAWSPDSNKIVTFQHDGRGVGEMYLVNTQVGHPKLEAWKYPLPGDEKIFMIERVVIDLGGEGAAAKVVRLKMPADPHRSTLCDHIVCGGVWADVQWGADSQQLAFVSTSRNHQEAKFRIADPATGDVRDVLEEKVKTFFESGNGRVNWRYLSATNELLWFSQRDNWGQLYLYDAQTGKLKNQITTGAGNVTQVLRVDEPSRQLYFLGVGKERGRDPYFRHFYRIGFDGKGLKLLTPEDADHDIALAPSGQYFTDSYSKPDVPPIAVVRDADGKLIATLEKADIARLLATGWQPPQPITVKARDGVTDLYGLMYKPTKLDLNKKYPIINNIYPGPQTGSVRGRSFSAGGDQQALAELGFVVVQIDGMGTPWRSKKFHEAYFGDMGDNTLPDQITGMKQLAQRYSWIDIERAGIYGHSGGGYATAAAMFRHPDFFKVGVSQAGNHDNRGYEDDWAEKWSDLLVRKPDGTSNYDSQANQNFAKNLKGKLLLAHGTLDNNVPPYNTLLVVNELIKANKDFDLIMFPNRPHGFGSEAYMTRRRWDYFVRHLLGAEPPREFELKPPVQAGPLGGN